MSTEDSTSIPYGYCHCGCGQKTKLAGKTNVKRGWVKGEPLRFIHNHHGRLDSHPCNCGRGRSRAEHHAARFSEHQEWWSATYPNIPYGTCACGCGKATKTASWSYEGRDWIKDCPQPFLKGHRTPEEPTEFHGVNNNGGLCECGCGEPTNLSPVTLKERGYVRGEPVRFLRGHERKLFSKLIRAEAYVIDPETGCWIWLMNRNPKGYGTVWHEGRCWLAHRLSYTLTIGPIPEGKQLDHLCKRPWCVRPDHLEPVTNTENQRRGLQPKLSIEDAKDIRGLYSGGNYTQTGLAHLYKVHRDTIGRIIREESWKA